MQQYTSRVTVMLTPEMRGEIETLAKTQGMNFSDLVRQALKFYLAYSAEPQDEEVAQDA
jgi:metal-responsive CopG/Arc/MetJ family transcriptional regulator